MAVLDDAEGCERYSIDPHLQGYGVQGPPKHAWSPPSRIGKCFSATIRLNTPDPKYSTHGPPVLTWGTTIRPGYLCRTFRKLGGHVQPVATGVCRYQTPPLFVKADGAKPENGGFNVVPSSREPIGKASGIEHKGLGCVADGGDAIHIRCASRAQAQPRGYHSRYSIAGQKDAYGGEPVHVQDHGADESQQGSTPHAVANWEAFSAADL
ncbi:hypothetical protein B0H14DRAFT_2591387 [Mycena olivaceomarginata]|nr:hypothetical protein B0H14DRAFT_2591387 [Mycena olivaceomarginata]